MTARIPPATKPGPRPANGPRWLRWALIAAIPALVALHMVETLSLWGKMGSDYNVFYDGARQFVRDPLALYPPDARHTLLGYLYPPPSILLFLPLLLGSLEHSFLFANAVVLGCGMTACALWLRLVRERHGLTHDRLGTMVIFGLAMGVGAMLAVRQGQVDTIILLLCVAPVWFESRGQPRLAGALIAAGCWIKIYPVLLLFWLWCSPARRQLLTGFVAAAVGIPLASLAVIPPQLYLDYFQQQLPAMSGRAIINIDNQSLAAVLLRTGTPLANYVGSYQALPLPGWFRAGIVAVMLGGMGAVVWHVRRTGAPALLVASWGMAFACLIAPLGWGHTYCLLLPLLIHVARITLDRASTGARGALAQGALIVACYAALLPAGHFRLPFETAIPAWAAQLFYARYALAALLLLAISWQQQRNAREPVVPDQPA